MNNRSNKLLFDVLTACREIRSFLTGKTRHDYLNDILPGLANRYIQEVADITPTRWAARHSR